jgi:hypothetical protein
MEINVKRTHAMIAVILVVAFTLSLSASAENIDPYDGDMQYAWGENVGWFNFEPSTGDGVQVASDKLTGYIWAENISWINLSCENTGYCGTVDFGVVNDGTGNLSGYAWSENVGWISFSCDNTSSCATVDYGVTIDDDGNFDGYAWGENIGWISFGLADHYVVACKVTFEDLANFVDDWLDSGAVPGNLDGLDNVDMIDYSIFAGYWQGYCPDNWLLK